MKTNRSRLDIIEEFYAAPPQTLFPQETLCAVLDCSNALAERNRWAGTGAPFVKIGRSVRYRKADILNWFEKQKTVQSTTQAQAK